MDTSETYIKMCGKAEEIQAEWQPACWDYFGHDGRIWVISGYETDGGFYGPEILDEGQMEWGIGYKGLRLASRDEDESNPVWLPRQDQLQELASLSWYSLDGACEDFSEAPTKEQAAIQVAMKEKYNKVWNGEDWVKGAKG